MRGPGPAAVPDALGPALGRPPGGHPGAPHRARPSPRPPPWVRGDKACSSRADRDHLRKRGIRSTIPEPADRAAHRERRGKAGGRPPAFDREDHKARFRGDSLMESHAPLPRGRLWDIGSRRSPLGRCGAWSTGPAGTVPPGEPWPTGQAPGDKAAGRDSPRRGVFAARRPRPGRGGAGDRRAARCWTSVDVVDLAQDEGQDAVLAPACSPHAREIRSDGSTLCARRRAATDPLPRRTIRGGRLPSSPRTSRTCTRSATRST